MDVSYAPYIHFHSFIHNIVGQKWIRLGVEGGREGVNDATNRLFMKRVGLSLSLSLSFSLSLSLFSVSLFGDLLRSTSSKSEYNASTVK